MQNRRFMQMRQRNHIGIAPLLNLRFTQRRVRQLDAFVFFVAHFHFGSVFVEGGGGDERAGGGGAGVVSGEEFEGEEIGGAG